MRIAARGRAIAAAVAMVSALALDVDATAPVESTAAEAAAEVAPLALLSTQQLDERTRDLTFTTGALVGQTTVRVLLPKGYDPTTATRYPVLYLLHGGAADYRSWTALGGIAHILTEDLPLITVMPDAGRSAWYTDWYNNGAGGPPMWETFHIEQLMPWIDANFATVGTRAGRAIAGLSSGGFGAMSYASRHPDLFVAAAAFSGAVDTNTHPIIGPKVIDALALQDRGGPGSLWGLRETQEVRWRGHNPWDLASNLRDLSITLRTGNGESGGPFGGGGPSDPVGMALEAACHAQSVSLHEHLEELGVQHVWDDYGPGTHTFPYWNRSLAQTLPTFMQVFAEDRPDPASFSYRSIEPSYSVYGWDVSMSRPALEFSSLDDASIGGFTVTGSGSAAVATPPRYVPGAAYRIAMSGASGDVTQQVTADGEGRLHLTVPLGAGNPTQQYFTPVHSSPATIVNTTVVTIEAATP